MSDAQHPHPEPTAVDDVRRVREKIALEHGGELGQHAAETIRVGERLRGALNVHVVPAPGHDTRRSGTLG